MSCNTNCPCSTSALHCSFCYFIIAILNYPYGSTLHTWARTIPTRDPGKCTSAEQPLLCCKAQPVRSRAGVSRARSTGLASSAVAVACHPAKALLGLTVQPWIVGASLKFLGAARALLQLCQQNWAGCQREAECASKGHRLLLRKRCHLRAKESNIHLSWGPEAYRILLHWTGLLVCSKPINNAFKLHLFLLNTHFWCSGELGPSRVSS